jgi:hypothetical protein
MDTLIASNKLYKNVQAEIYITRGNRLSIALMHARLALHRQNGVIYYTHKRDKSEVAQFKTDVLNELGVVWFYDDDGYQTAYIGIRSKCHVVHIKQRKVRLWRNESLT